MSAADEGFDGRELAKLKRLFHAPNGTPAAATTARKAKGATLADRLALEDEALGKVDRRTLRKTGRTEQLNLRVSVETRASVDAVCEAYGWSISEMFELAIIELKKTKPVPKV